MRQNIYFESGFDDDEATVLALETDAAIAIAHYIRQTYPNNQKAAARHLRIGQNEVSALLSANIGRFALQKLIRIARRAGLRLYMDMGSNAHGACATLVPVFQGGIGIGVQSADFDFLAIEPALVTPDTKRVDNKRVSSTVANKQMVN